jgi:basic amino acid/polyamine antiporter, APA family
VTTVYVLVALAGIGAQPYERFEGQEAGLALILRNITGSDWAPALLSAGAVISIFSVTLVTLYGQTRILFAMGRDGMLPEVFHRVDPRTLSPVRNTIIVAIFVGILAGFVPLGVLIDLTSMGTLVAFTVVSIGVIILRRTQPDLPRGFRVPGYPVTPVLSAAFALYIISRLPYSTFALFAVWLGVAGIIYFTYSMRHSRLARGQVVATDEEPR